MAKYGYIRNDYPESTVDQIRKLSLYKCDEVLIDYDQHSNAEVLQKLLKNLNENDQIIISDLRSFFSSIKSLKEIFTILEIKNVRLISIDDDIDTNQSITLYKDLIKIFHIDEKHRSHIVKLSIEKARSEGRIGGRPKIDISLVETITSMYRKDRKTIREIAEICDVSIGTVHKYININKEE